MIHVPKTGGTTLQSQWPGSVLGDLCEESGVSGGTHKTASSIQKMFPEEWDKYLTIGFVREPLSRFCSTYFFSNMRRRKNVEVKVDAIWREMARREVYKPMGYWLDRTIDFIGRFEDYRQEVQRLLEKIGVEREIPHFRKTNSSEIELPEDVREFVEWIYEEDAIRFGYGR